MADGPEPQNYPSTASSLHQRPMGLGRSSIARTVFHRMIEDEKHKHDCHEHWYTIDINKLPMEIGDKCIRFQQDMQTREFLELCYEKSDWVFTQIFHVLARSVLGWFMTNTSINGYLDRGSMFVFSQLQLRRLLGITDQWQGDNLLDLGAGDGKITQIMGKYFNNVFVTEASSTMESRLEEKGFQVLGVNDWSNGDRQYDLIGCLNLLDRCDKPISMLHSMRASIKPVTGRVLLALVVPFKPYVETSTNDHKPTEVIHVEGTTFEEQVTSLVRNTFEPAGYELEHFTRLPYLCEGDLQQSFYVLNDAIFVLKLKDNDTSV